MRRLRDVARGLGMGEVGCGDNSCIWGSPGGMGTNGGCRCYETPQEARLTARRFARVAQHLLGVADGFVE